MFSSIESRKIKILILNFFCLSLKLADYTVLTFVDLFLPFKRSNTKIEIMRVFNRYHTLKTEPVNQILENH